MYIDIRKVRSTSENHRVFIHTLNNLPGYSVMTARTNDASHNTMHTLHRRCIRFHARARNEASKQVCIRESSLVRNDACC